MHVHDVDQIFYILRGTMSVEIESRFSPSWTSMSGRGA
jgi:mannose-6-phosphate isomerase-like protein (cupin superfamily)